MTIGKLSSLAASIAVLALSLITLASTPVAVEATDCTADGSQIAMGCLDSYPGGGFLCWQCVWAVCGQFAQGNEECYTTCSAQGVQMCGGA